MGLSDPKIVGCKSASIRKYFALEGSTSIISDGRNRRKNADLSNSNIVEQSIALKTQVLLLGEGRIKLDPKNYQFSSVQFLRRSLVFFLKKD